jgi:tetratricopeptide (TPR) repeat protein
VERLFNAGDTETARRIFQTTGYSDGLMRVGERYLDGGQPIDALKMFKLAHDGKRSDELIERAALSHTKNTGRRGKSMSDLTNQDDELGFDAGTAPQQNQELMEIAELSKKGYQFLKENRVGDAERNFRQIIEKDAENNYALVGLGDAARKRGAHRDAVDHYKKCLIYHPGNNYALFGLADCYKALNQYQKAIEIWEQYLLHDNKNITVLTRIADAYRKVRDFRKSKAIYLRVLEMEMDNPYALIGLGHLHYDFKEYRDALHYWQRMVHAQGDAVDIRVLTSIGNCYRKLKQFDMGVPYFEKA